MHNGGGALSETRVNWRQVLVTALLTGTVTVCTGMVLFTLQQREPRLSYQVSDAVPFDSGSEKLAIYNVTLTSEGRRAAKDVRCQVDIGPALIAQSKVSADASLPYTSSNNGSVCTLTVPTINPNDTITVSILTRSFSVPATTPKVSLRADGVTGKPADRSTPPKWLQYLISLVAAFAGLMAGAVQLIARRRFGAKAGVHSDDQRKVLAYLFGIRGRTTEAEHYLRMTSDVSYWSEADYLAATALESKDNALIAATSQVLTDLLAYARVAPESVGIIHYNLARLAEAQGKPAEHDTHLSLAKREIPKLLEERLRIDGSSSQIEKRA